MRLRNTWMVERYSQIPWHVIRDMTSLLHQEANPILTMKICTLPCHSPWLYKNSLFLTQEAAICNPQKPNFWWLRTLWFGFPESCSHVCWSICIGRIYRHTPGLNAHYLTFQNHIASGFRRLAARDQSHELLLRGWVVSRGGRERVWAEEASTVCHNQADSGEIPWWPDFQGGHAETIDQVLASVYSGASPICNWRDYTLWKQTSSWAATKDVWP